MKIGVCEQAAVVHAHQEGSVCPLTDEVAIKPATLDHDMRDTEGKPSIRSRSHAQPDVGFIRGTDTSRVDDNQARASLERRRGGNGMRESSDVRIVAPK
jgi:hypothetical protein